MINSLNIRVSQLLDKHLSFDGFNPNILYLPTGDGMAVVFMASSRFTKALPFSLLDELVELIREEREKKEGIKLRIGIHHGTINRITINRYPNVCGATINLCQRVMDAAHPNQMLISDGAFEEYGVIIQERYNCSSSPLKVIAKHNLELRVHILSEKSDNILTIDEPYPHGFIEGREERTLFLVERIQGINKTVSKKELKGIHIYEQAAFSTFWISPEAIDLQEDKDMNDEYKDLLVQQQQALNELVEKAGQFKMILDPTSRPYSAQAMAARYKALLAWMKSHLSNRKIDWVESKSIGPNRLIINPKFCFEGYKHSPTAGYKSSLIYYDEAKLQETITSFDRIFNEANQDGQDKRKQDVIDRFTQYMEEERKRQLPNHKIP